MRNGTCWLFASGALLVFTAWGTQVYLESIRREQEDAFRNLRQQLDRVRDKLTQTARLLEEQPDDGLLDDNE